jgi:hypothetical protein
MKRDKEITPLRRAVDWLKKERRIKRDNDLMELFGLGKSTISVYLSGKASPDFEEEFERKFKISLKDFETKKANPPAMTDNTLEQSLLNLTESNKQLVETIKTQAEVHLVEAQANRLVAETNYSAMRELTNSGSSKEFLPSFSSQLKPVIELMAKNGTRFPGLWKTQQEGVATLDKLLAFYEEENQKYNNDHRDVDKSSK